MSNEEEQDMGFDKNFFQGLPPAKREPRQEVRTLAQITAEHIQAFRDAGMSKREAFEMTQTIIVAHIEGGQQ